MHAGDGRDGNMTTSLKFIVGCYDNCNIYFNENGDCVSGKGFAFKGIKENMVCLVLVVSKCWKLAQMDK